MVDVLQKMAKGGVPVTDPRHPPVIRPTHVIAAVAGGGACIMPAAQVAGGAAHAVATDAA